MINTFFADMRKLASEFSNTYELQLPHYTLRLCVESHTMTDDFNSHFVAVSPGHPDNPPDRLLLINHSIESKKWKNMLGDGPAFASSVTGRGSFPVHWWPPSGRRHVWAAEYSGTQHRILSAQGDTCLLLHQGGPTPLRYSQRVLREILIHKGRKRNFLMVHGAAVALESDSGLLLLGNRGAGKTDVALRLLRSYGGSVVSVDRLLLGLDGCGRLMAINLPFGFNVAVETWPAIGVSLTDAKAIGRYQDNKVYVDQRDFVRLTGIAVAKTCHVTAIGILDDQEENRVHPDELIECINAHCLYGRDPGYLYDWLGLAGDPSNLQCQKKVLESWPLDLLARRSFVLRHQAGAPPPQALLALFL